jgi:hypothetical protein
MLTVGSQGLYEWLVTNDDFKLLELCPEIVVGKYLAISSLDSGEFVPTDEEAAIGWRSRGRIAYSPKITNAQDVPHGGWDEWYIFDSPADLGTSHLADNIFDVPQEQGHVSVFVNYGFALHPADRAGLSNLFWPQIVRLRPESYVSDNDYLTLVSMNKALFANVHDAVRTIGTL